MNSRTFAAIVILASLAVPATARIASAEMKTGSAAFGGWQDDAPGVRRHFTLRDMPPAVVNGGKSNGASVKKLTEGTQPRVPDGFSVQMVASGLAGPRVVRVAPNGDLFVADSKANRIIVLRLGEGMAKPIERAQFADGLDQPYGIAFYPPGADPHWVYVANAGSVLRFAYQNGDMTARGQPEQVISGIPTSHHWTRDIAFSPDGQTLYLSVGSGSNIAEGMTKKPPRGLEAWTKTAPVGATWGAEARRADVLAFSPDGKNERIFATGLRNCSGLTVAPQSGELWCVVNERDQLGNDVPFDYATRVASGSFFGWPWFFIGGNEDPRHAGERPDLADKVAVPDVLFQPHSAPLNIAFYEGDNFPDDYRGDAFVTLHGSWNRGTRTGYKVVRLLFDKGRPTGEYEDFATGFVTSDKTVWGRPVGVAVAKDGALIISEDGSGTIWRVTHGAR